MENNRLQLKTLIESVRWLTFQACAFRGYDESSDSKNQVNFIKLIKLLTSYNDQVNGVVIENAPQNAKYTSPKIQKEILHIFANKVRNVIREEIRDAKFCILVDKARDESKREQMRYDGESNMRGEWNGLQALFLKNCPYAYYMHCCAHKLQLALVAASREAKHVHQFFVHLTSIINIIAGSSKRHDELQSAQAAEIESLIASKEIETGKWANQIGTLQRAGDTRWGSHFQSVCSLMRMFSAICSVINTISNEGSNYSQRGDSKAAYMILTYFEFIF
ncbi:zinc finger MYM-type protein 1-like [Carya illinoinensis]|uniref:zinc finger MYM-type protein 1-like n=1 Tax=Carya illinoinensis TaxID=32201 RepID=UPI001C71B0C2|nr:zinc finger MYM-type protein 1-like [Carya illinoinensis]